MAEIVFSKAPEVGKPAGSFLINLLVSSEIDGTSTFGLVKSTIKGVPGYSILQPTIPVYVIVNGETIGVTHFALSEDDTHLVPQHNALEIYVGEDMVEYNLEDGRCETDFPLVTLVPAA